MRKFIYRSIVDQLKTILDNQDNPSIKHFDIWNNNLAHIEQEHPFLTPAVFVEFQPIQWKLDGNKVREATVNIALHVINQCNAPTSDEGDYVETSLLFFDLLTKINKALYQHHNAGEQGCLFSHNALTPIQSITDHDFDKLQHNIEEFACNAFDWSAHPNYATKSGAKLQINT